MSGDHSNNHRDAGMVILPAYYAASLNTDPEQVIQYYVDICAASPVSPEVDINVSCPLKVLILTKIPLLLYNFPSNAGGQDMSSDIINSVIRKANNLCGVKLT